MPSQAEVEQYQEDVDELSVLAVAEITALIVAASGDDEQDPRSLVKAIVAAIEPFLVAATELALDWYRSLARRTPRAPENRPGAPAPTIGPTDRLSLLDAQDFEPRPAELPPTEQLEASVWWALAAPEPTTTRTETVPDPERDPTTRAARPAPVPDPDRDTTVRATRPTPPPAATAPSAVNDEIDLNDEADEPLQARVVAPSEGSGRARVVPAGETGPRAQVIPATEEQQAAVISRLAGATQRYVQQAARDTITDNAEREGVRWRRHAQPDACAFCRLLSTRDDYLSEESAVKVVGRRGRPRGTRNLGETYHDFCRCEPVAVRAGDSWTPPNYASEWENQYEKAVAEVGNRSDIKRILAVMRAAEKARGGTGR